MDAPVEVADRLSTGVDRAERITLAVCIATYRRPKGLARLLASLCQLEFPADNMPIWCVVVVENEASMPSRDVVDGARPGLPVPLIYGVEPVRGIASARNNAVKLAGDVDLVAFIDDDEVASNLWLAELLACRARFNADVVAGPVLARFQAPPPAWVLRGRFFDQPRFTTGASVAYPSTNNVLIRTSWLRRVQGPFDPELNLRGGSDALFFAKIRHQGAKMVWSDEAIVEEYNPASRVSTGWLLRRAFRMGAGHSRIDLEVYSSILVTGLRVLKCMSHVCAGVLVLIPAAIVMGYAGVVRGLALLSRSAGEIAGLMGLGYDEYRNVHGA
jgi:succinoglycan biosynthesis protein ExoM